MKPKSNLPRRRAMRLRGYDYSQPGAYFVTICVQHRQCLFGAIIDGKMHLNEIGEIVVECWNRIPQHFSSVEIGEYVIMPNHIHGIIAWDIAEVRSPNPQENAKKRRGEVTSPSLGKNAEARSPNPQENARKRRGEVTSPSLGKNAEARSPNPQENARKRRGEVTSPSLGKIVAYFKYQSTKHINQHHNTPGTRIWQRNYHDHIIRDDIDLQRLREYIQNNPRKWELDQLHPDNNGWGNPAPT